MTQSLRCCKQLLVTVSVFCYTGRVCNFTVVDDALFTKLFNEISFLAKLVELYQVAGYCSNSSC